MGASKNLKALKDEPARDFAKRLGRPLGPVVAAAVAMIEKHIPHATQSVKWGWPCWAGNGNVVSVIVHRKHVNLEFWRGAHLENPDKALQGTGKDLRHIKLHKAADARRPEVIAVLKAACKADAG
ncbi:MAG: DUF1801 domain-containing protein [Planctomycetes bacterium]|nr:DUF1801 domain-containing protein [Planctomycetota bacterium]